MFRLAVRGMLAHKLRFALTTFAVVIGVGFVVGSLVVTDSLRGSVDNLFANISKGIDVSVRASTGLGQGGSDITASRGRVPADLLPEVRAVDGVAALQGSVDGYAQLVDKKGEPVTSTGGAPFLGVSWWQDDLSTAAKLVEGRRPVGREQVAIDRATADQYGFRVGDRTRVLLADGTRPDVRVVGIFTFGEANNLLGARLTAFDGRVAPEVLGSPGEYTTIDVRADPGVSPADLSARIEAALPVGVEAVPTDRVVSEGSASVEGFLDVFGNILLGFAAVSLFVAAFYINNTFSITLGQRTKEFALLRAIGASSGQVTRSVVGEALFVGVVASAVGVGFGLLIASLLRAVLSAGGFDLPDDQLVLEWRTWLAAAVVGIGVTVAASVAPARRASTVSPVEGMREGYVPTRWSRRTRLSLGVALVVVGAALVAVGLFVADGATPVILTLGSGALVAFLGVAQLSPVVAVPVAGTLGRPLAWAFRTAGRLARANAVRNPVRTAKTASALMIGLALVTTVFVVGTSVKQTFAASIDTAVRADYVVSTSGMTGFSPALVPELAELPEVSAATGVRFDRFLFEGKERDLVAVDPVPAGEVVDIDLRAGSLADLRPGSIFVHVDPAQDLRLAVGDTVNVEFATGGPQRLQVAGVYGDSTWAGNYLADLDTFARYYPANELDMFAFVKVAPGVDGADAKAAIERVLDAYPQVTLENRSAFSASQEEQLDGLLVAINGLLALALFIALLGIANTLALSVLERTREIGLLRAVGMLRRQARQMVLAEAVTVAVFGAVLGVVVGVLFGVATASALPESAVTSVVVPVGTLVGIVVAAAVAGTLAGVAPARRAARLDVLRAIAAE